MNKTRFFVSILALITFYGCADNKAFEVDLCPKDLTKTVPGVCGCGVPDVDTDGDGTLDCIDLCLDNPEKTTPGKCGCNEPDVDSDGDDKLDCMEQCKDDPNKQLPGVCGCGKLDEDIDGNGIIDCLEQDIDLCPDNPDKTKPEGVCGCGDEIDTDEDGVPDCIDQCPNNATKSEFGVCGCETDDIDRDGDGALECEDLCPEDRQKIKPGVCDCGVVDDDSDGDGIPDCLNVCENGVIDDHGKAKAFPGLCGCNKLDTPENTSDEDHDGVINCLDSCPYNPTKSKAVDGDCNEMDSDGDSVDDSMDKCPYNPKIDDILELDEEQGTEQECSTYVEAENIFYIYNAHNFDELKNRLKKIHDDTICSTGAKTCVSESGTEKSISARQCENKLWQYYSCVSCVDQETNEDGEIVTPFECEGETSVKMERKLTIELVNDINLIDYIQTSLKVNGECYGTWLDNFNLTNVVFHGNNKTISYKQNTNTCSLNNAFFNSITLSEVSDLTIELNVSNSSSSVLSRAIFANEINSSNVSHVHVKGSLTTAYTGTDGKYAVGGIAGYVHSAYSIYGNTQIVDCDAPNIEVTSIAPETKGAYLGGYFGYLTTSSLTLSGKHVVKSVKSKRNAGGFFGALIKTNNTDMINLENAEFQIDSINAYNAGGFAYSMSFTKCDDPSLTIKSFKANNVQSNKANAAGFIYTLTGALKDIKSEISSIVSPSGAAGFVYTSSKNTYTNINNSVKKLECNNGTTSKDDKLECAGFIHDASSDSYDHIDNHIDAIESKMGGAGFIYSVTDGFELANSVIAVGALQADNVYGIYADYKVSSTSTTGKSILNITGTHFSANQMLATNIAVGLFGKIPSPSDVNLDNVSVFVNLNGADLAKIHSVVGEIAVPTDDAKIHFGFKNGFYAISNSVDDVVQENYTIFDTLNSLNGTAIASNAIDNNYFLVPSTDTNLFDITLPVDPFSGYVELITPDNIDAALSGLQGDGTDTHWGEKTFTIYGDNYPLPAYMP